MSNTLIFGEKQIFSSGDTRADHRNRSSLFEYNYDEEWGCEPWGGYDGSWLLLGVDRNFTVFRPVNQRGLKTNLDAVDSGLTVGIQPRNHFRTLWDARPMGFGSWHTGTSNFVRGDGSVAGISDTINHYTLAKLGVVGDGSAVSVP